MRLKKGDKVKIIAGKDKGRQGTIERVFPKKRKVLVSGVNIYKKHVRARKEGEKGGIIDLVVPMPVSSVMLICPKCGKPTRVGFRIIKEEKENGKTFSKLRICKKCQEII